MTNFLTKRRLLVLAALGTGQYLWKEIHYVHINPYAGVIGRTFDATSNGWNLFPLGLVASSQPAGCPTTGPHLHQSSWDEPGMWNNYGLGDPINPTSDVYGNWLHTLDRWW